MDALKAEDVMVPKITSSLLWDDISEKNLQKCVLKITLAARVFPPCWSYLISPCSSFFFYNLSRLKVELCFRLFRLSCFDVRSFYRERFCFLIELDIPMLILTTFKEVKWVCYCFLITCHLWLFFGLPTLPPSGSRFFGFTHFFFLYEGFSYLPYCICNIPEVTSFTGACI